MPWHSLYVSLCVSLLICSLCSSAHATATHLSLSYAPLPSFGMPLLPLLSLSYPPTSCASLSILLLCAQIVRHDRKSLSHAAAALDATPTPPPFGFLASSNKCSDSGDTHTGRHCIGKLNFSPERACVVIIVIDIAYTHSAQTALELLEQGTRHLTLVKQNRN